jgi:hypothetical protein
MRLIYINVLHIRGYQMGIINLDDSIFTDDRFSLVETQLSKYEAMGQMVYIIKLARKYWADGEKPIPKDELAKGKYSTCFVRYGLLKEKKGGFYLKGSRKYFGRNVKQQGNLCPFDIERVYSELYPLKKGKARGLEILRTKIKTEEDYRDFTRSVENYALECKINGTEKKYMKHFSTFANCWTDYTNIAVEVPKTKEEERQSRILAMIKHFGEESE